MNPIPWLIPGPLHAVVLAVVVVVLLHQRRLRAPRWLRAGGWLALLWIWLASTPAIGNFFVRALENQHPAVELSTLKAQPTGAVVVLASGQMFRPDGTPSPVLDADGWERLLAGVALWRQVGGQLILAGGPGSAPHDSLAQVMRRIALDAGVPAEAILVAGGGRNTHEDLRAAQVAWAGLGRQGASPWLVTSALHMPRAMGVAAALGFELRAAPCGFRHLRPPTWRAWWPDNGDAVLWRDGLHEWVGMAVYRWRGWLR